MLTPYDRIVLMTAGYCDSLEMEKAQEFWLRENAQKVPRKWKGATEHPCDVPERAREARAAKEKAEAISNGTKMLCRNWGCGNIYEYSEDPISTKVCGSILPII
jgi:hypothetical protein